MATLAQRSLARGHRVLRAHYQTPAHYQAPATTPDGTPPAVVATHVVIDQGDLADHELELIGVAFKRHARVLIMGAEVPEPVWQGQIIIADGPYAATWIIRSTRALAGGDHEALCGADQQVSLQHESAGWGAPLA